MRSLSQQSHVSEVEIIERTGDGEQSRTMIANVRTGGREGEGERREGGENMCLITIDVSD